MESTTGKQGRMALSPRRLFVGMAGALGMATLSLFVFASSAHATVYTGRGGNASTVAICDSAQHTLKIDVRMIPDRSSAFIYTQSVFADVWVSYNGNRWQYLGRNEGTVYGDGVFSFGFGPSQVRPGQYVVYAKYGWLTTAGWDYSRAEYASYHQFDNPLYFGHASSTCKA